ncbi:MAG: hypothetical protein A2Y15_05515 [Clostridiales bacterium GWF2_36_10]|nr:MAG: hypothetical protein A2Y15_05515 [Clostridiales bacterium GWF2_36_10]HAN21999.1 hypothetical protein [Clostridiales bacterium]
MAIEAVEAVYQAEQNAIQKEKEAVKERDAILLKAQQEANEMISAITKEALEKVKNKLQEANTQGEKVVETSKIRANEEIIKIKEIVDKKSCEAINFIISYIA